MLLLPLFSIVSKKMHAIGTLNRDSNSRMPQNLFGKHFGNIEKKEKN